MKYAIKGGNLIDVVRGELVSRTTILVENDKIKKVGKEAVEIPKGYEVIEAYGKTVMPGLIDAHVHFSLGGEPNYGELFIKQPVALVAIKAASYAQRTLKAGFTTVRDMGAVGWVGISLREAIKGGIAKGPRVLASGHLLSITSGHADFFPPWVKVEEMIGRVADGVPELRRAVREQIAAGADWIKFCATGGLMDPGSKPGIQEYTEEEMKTIVEEARKAGKRVAAHAQGTEGIKAAIRAGVDTIEHGALLDEEAIELMVKNGTYLIPTLTAFHKILEHAAEGERRIPEYVVKKAEKLRERRVESFKAAVAAGVKIALGTDAGTPFNRHGENAVELELMMEHGLSEIDALRAATMGAAEALGLSGMIGSIEEGKSADLIIVDGNPLEEITVLQRAERIELVLKEGVLDEDR